jgi:8-oxo-dGTP pyrophosphatase MutT (NUDIX family)
MRTIQRTIVSALIYSNDGKLLMGKKDPGKGGVYSDCWHIPGGGIEDGEDKVTALIREVKEEVGIDISKYKIEFVTDEDKGSAERTLASGEKVIAEMQFNVYKIVLEDWNSDKTDFIFNDDLVQAQWFTISEIGTVKLTPPSEKYFRKIGYIHPLK